MRLNLRRPPAPPGSPGRLLLEGRELRLDPGRIIGEGGEATIFDLGRGRALKLFKPPEHADFAADPEARRAAELRLREHQTKLAAFPRPAPARIVAPEAPATDDRGRVVGYAMRLVSGAEVLLRYGERAFREGAGIDQNQVVAILRDLRETVAAAHAAGIVIGDLNDLNVLVRRGEAWLIDADSYQWGGYLCHAFTERFLDPRLSLPGERPVLGRPYDADADWYAFEAMLLQSLLHVGPYGGVHRPADPARRVSQAARPLRRITIFDADVRYPKPARPWTILPDDVLEHLLATFQRDARGPYPRALLEAMRWTVCTRCGLEHARGVCPACTSPNPAAVRAVTRVRGHIVATRVVRVDGEILDARFAGGRLAWIERVGGTLRRESGAVLAGLPAFGPGLTVHIAGRRTVAAVPGAGTIVADAAGNALRFAADAPTGLPALDANDEHVYWAGAGALWRDDVTGPERLGDVLAGQTRIWVGPAFGFGFYRARDLTVAFTFDARARGVNDGVRVAPIRGQLVNASAHLSRALCWFFATTHEGGRDRVRLTVLRADGGIVASAETDDPRTGWWAGLRGACASGQALYIPTDDGVVRLRADGSGVAVAAEFPDTEPFVAADQRLLAGPDGLYVVGRSEIVRLELR